MRSLSYYYSQNIKPTGTGIFDEKLQDGHFSIFNHHPNLSLSERFLNHKYTKCTTFSKTNTFVVIDFNKI